MYETIYIEKNKSTKFGVYFYEDGAQWNVFKDVCGIQSAQFAVICSETMQNKTWESWRDSFDKDNLLKFKKANDENDARLRDFINNKKKDYTFIILSDSVIMDALHRVFDGNDSKLSMIMVPVTPDSVFAGVSISPLVDGEGSVIRKELLPKAVYLDLSVLTTASPLQFLDGIAAAFKLSVSYKASMFEWMISNMYELTDGDENAIYELTQRGIQVWKERIEKDTAKERAIGVYGEEFYRLLKNANSDLSEADLTSLSLVCQTYLSWKKDLLSMEEFYEIRDMLVFFGLSITQTFASAEELVAIMEHTDSSLCYAKESVYIRKLGKLIIDTIPSKELIKESLEQIYFDEDANE